jgi:hypothetical protein
MAEEIYMCLSRPPWTVFSSAGLKLGLRYGARGPADGMH